MLNCKELRNEVHDSPKNLYVIYDTDITVKLLQSLFLKYIYLR
jgi:hypothetical protein